MSESFTEIQVEKAVENQVVSRAAWRRVPAELRKHPPLRGLAYIHISRGNLVWQNNTVSVVCPVELMLF